MHTPAALWNEVEQVEKNYNAQLAYSFDMALQNEFSLEENIELAKEFVQKYFVSDGMIADLAIHKPDKEEGGIPNPHFHVLVPIRPLNADGTWGAKQRREYHLDENGNRIKKENGGWEFDAVPTTNWGKPETLDMWREAWADMVNEWKPAEEGQQRSIFVYRLFLPFELFSGDMQPLLYPLPFTEIPHAVGGEAAQTVAGGCNRVCDQRVTSGNQCSNKEKFCTERNDSCCQKASYEESDIS